MLKRDRIFYFACGLSGVGVILAVMGYEFSLLFFVAAYLLRPTLHEFGLARQYADERQLEIHSRSGNLAFITIMLAIVGMVFWRIADGQSAGELYMLIGIGLVARALTGLVMAGEYRKAGVIIITAAGLLFAIFIILMEGFSIASAFGVGVGLVIIGFGQVARKYPKTMAIVQAFFAVCVIMFLNLLQFRRIDVTIWLLLVMPVLTSAVCLWLGRKGDDANISPKVRTTVFGALATSAAVVFTLLIVVGSGEESSVGRSVTLNEDEVIEIEGVSCTGGIEYYKDGSLMHCSLARDDTLLGQPLAAGTGVHFTEDGIFEWCFLRENTEIQGYLCRGEGHGFMTRFHPNGQLRTAWLAENKVIQGIPCRKFQFISAVWNPIHGKNGNTSFHENGQLRYCELSENATIQEIDFRKGDAVRFDEEGMLVM